MSCRSLGLLIIFETSSSLSEAFVTGGKAFATGAGAFIRGVALDLAIPGYSEVYDSDKLGVGVDEWQEQAEGGVFLKRSAAGVPAVDEALSSSSCRGDNCEG